MVRRQIDFDEETDRILSELAQDFEGDVGKALADLVHAHESIETFVEQCEEAHRAALLAQVEGSERAFREGRVTTWGEVRRRSRV
jgi:hypothetical protein